MPDTRKRETRTKILFVLSGLSRGGAERVVIDLVNGIDRTQFEPVVCSFREGPLRNEISQATPVYSGLARYRHDPALPLRLWKVLKHERPAIVDVVGTGDVGILGRLMPLLANRPIVIQSLHNTGRLDGNDAVEAFNRWLTPITACFVAVGEAHRRYMIESLGVPRDRIVLIYNGVGVPPLDNSLTRADIRRLLGYSESNVVVGMVARFHPMKAHDVLLRAAAGLLQTSPELRLLLIGGGDRLESMRLLAHELGLGQKAQFLGERDDVRQLLAAVDIYASSSSCCEAFSVSILEAMSAGLPVVATRVGAVEDQVVDGLTGVLVSPRSPEALAKGLEPLISHPGLRREMGSRGEARAREHFSVDAMVSRRERLFRALAGSDAQTLSILVNA